MNSSSYPNFGNVVAKTREHMDFDVPNYVSSQQGSVQYCDGAYLGKEADPFIVDGNPSDPKFKVKHLDPPANLVKSLDDRGRLLHELDNFRRELDRSGLIDALDKFNRQAFGLLTSGRVRATFDLKNEPDAIRQRYGMNKWGQRALLARRLIEAGCSFVTMNMVNSREVVPKGAKSAGNWDSHSVNWHIFDELKVRLPYFDQTISVLFEDIYQRGLDKKVMVIVAGEFGRTPKIETTYHGARPLR